MEDQEQLTQAPATEDSRPAGFWVRGGAFAIDFIVVSAIVALSGVILGKAEWLETMILGAVYDTLMIGACGQTVGKMAAGVKVVRMDGAGVGYPRALGRHFAALLSALLLAAGYIMAAFTNKKRALHDFLAGTRVVYAGEVSAGRGSLMAVLAALLILSPAALAFLMIKTPAVAALFKRPGEKQSAYEKFQSLDVMSREGATKGNLSSMRASLVLYYADAEGAFPSDPRELISGSAKPPAPDMKFPYLESISRVNIQNHSTTDGIEFYGNEVCIQKSPKGETAIDGSKLRDTGKWGYVSDKDSPCRGTLFVDCTHNDYKGTPWYNW